MIKPLAQLKPAIKLVAAATLCLLAVSCNSAGSTAHRSGYIHQYDAGQYAASLRSATNAARTGKPADRAEAALIAGLSAHALGRPAESERWLRPLVRSTRRDIAGPAAATLGLIELDRKNHEQAASYFQRAAPLLSGDQAAQAGLRAGDALKALGRADAARLQYNLAYASADDTFLKDTIAQRLSSASFTIQLGAFLSPENAKRAADEAQSLAIGLGLGKPQITPTINPTGRTLHVVSIGSFHTRAEADAARLRFGRASIVAAVPTDN